MGVYARVAASSVLPGYEGNANGASGPQGTGGNAADLGAVVGLNRKSAQDQRKDESRLQQGKLHSDADPGAETERKISEWMAIP